ncbi:MAG TPA: serine/threonine-protein kinase [Nannocystaceae bacterium]|nr:serine/threonine-protein kinase [Nannocystaceae bacterium]
MTEPSDGTDGAVGTERSPRADAARLDRARVQASARAKLFRSAAPEHTLGRYVLAEALGAGGAGKVYAAHDPKLDRRVALKLVAHAGADHDARLFREARALARLSHPNIVHVYDVGSEIFDGESMLYIAMELVDGETLRGWLRQPRTTHAIVVMFREIAQGLAAAHDAGLIHRDFKPENVLIGRDGRPRVADFGLVRQPGADEPLEITRNSDDLPERLITRTGAVMGTPAYMAPEQFEGAKVDARVDQFAFAVSLFEAFHGERPFRGATLSELTARVVAGEQTRPAHPRKLPGRLRRLLERGLAIDPTQRFASMHEVITALDDRGRSPARIALGLATAGAVAGALWFARSDACAGTDAELAGTWNDDVRASLRSTILASDTSFATQVADATDEAFERWAVAWRTSSRDACAATKIEGRQTERVMDLRQSCLRLRRAEAASVIAVIQHGNAKTLARAGELALRLRSPTACDRTEALEDGAEPPPTAIATEVEAQREHLAQARALDQSGDHEAARSAVQAVLDRARALDYRPLAAEAEVALANVALTLGDVDGSEALGTAAFQDALATDHVVMMAYAASHMVQVLAASRRTPELAEPWLGHALAAAERVHDDGATRVLVLQREGVLRLRQERVDEALVTMRRSCELAEEIYGEMYPDTIKCWTNVAVAENARGNNDDALAIAERALAMRRDLFGADHPDLAAVHNIIATILDARGDVSASLEHLREATRLLESGFGPDHPDLAGVLFNIGNRLRVAGDDAGARESYLRTLAIYEKVHGPRSQNVAGVLNSIALTLQNEKRIDEARALYERAAAIFDEVSGKGVTGGVIAHNNLGNILLGLGHPGEALEEYEKARRAAEAQLGPEHPMYTHAFAGMGDALLALGQPARAVDPLTRAVELRAAQKHPETAKVRWHLARALWLADRRDDARAQLRILVDEKSPDAEQAARWLASDVMP